MTAKSQPEEQAPTRESPLTEGKPQDLRGSTTTRDDRSAHRRHQWLYEDLLA